MEAGRVGTLEVRAASTRGAAHRCRGEVRQDAVGCDRGRRPVRARRGRGRGRRRAPTRTAARSSPVRNALGYLAWALPGADLDTVDMVGALRAADRAVREAGPAPERRSTTLTVACRRAGLGRPGPPLPGGAGGRQPGAAADRRRVPAAVRQARSRSPTACRRRRGPADGVRGVLRRGEALVLASAGLGAPVRDDAGRRLPSAGVGGAARPGHLPAPAAVRPAVRSTTTGRRWSCGRGRKGDRRGPRLTCAVADRIANGGQGTVFRLADAARC